MADHCCAPCSDVPAPESPCALDALPHDAGDPPEAYPAFSYTFAYNMTAGSVACQRRRKGLAQVATA